MTVQERARQTAADEPAPVEDKWRRRGRRRAVVAGVLVIAAIVASAVPFRASRREFVQPPFALVVSAPADRGWSHALARIGETVETAAFDASDLRSRRFVVVPSGAGADAADLISWVSDGGALVTSDAALLRDLGFTFGEDTVPSDVRDRFGEDAMTWPASVSARPLTAPADAGPPASLITSTQGPLAVAVTLGAGQIVALGWEPYAEPDNPEAAAARRPLELILRNVVESPDRIRAQGLELFVDPRLAITRYGPLTIKQLADRVAIAGAVNVAGWYDGSEPATTFDYAAFVNSLHDRGVLARLWLTPPHVSATFWNQHPECRQTSQVGDEVRIGWRHAVALEDPACIELAWQQVWSPILESAPWDGIVVSDFGYGTILALDGAEVVWPSHPAALARWEGERDQFDRDWNAFRAAVATDVAGEIVDRAVAAREDPSSFAVVLAPGVGGRDEGTARSAGIDLGRLSALATRVGASVQFTAAVPDAVGSDPTAACDGGTRRVSVTRTPASSDLAPLLGAALTELVAGCATGGRVAIDAFGAIDPLDLRQLPAVLASPARIERGVVDAPFNLVLRSPHPTWQVLRVDGRPYPVSHGVAVVPVGRHRIEWQEGFDIRPGIVRSTAELLSVQSEPAALALRYRSDGPALVTVDAQPTSVRVDGAPLEHPLRAYADRFVLSVPGGEHDLQITFEP